MTHPPWLRFQAYLVGLPKTGSTSVATIFAGYRTAHEWQMRDLLGAALPFVAGEIDVEQFWQRTTPRLTVPALEMDSATCHHLYPQLLVERFPKAVFVHSVRDVSGWLSSLLDMAMRYRFARTDLGIEYSEEELRYIDVMTDGTFDHARDPVEGDVAAIVALMHYWADHMRTMAAVLPEQRSVVVPTSDLAAQLPALAHLCRVPVETLRHDLTHSNRAAVRFDRLSNVATREIREAYEEQCADIMAHMFPQEHARISAWQPAGRSWDEHVAATRAHMRWAVATYGQRVAW